MSDDVARLIQRMEENEAEASEIRTEAEKLGLDAKKIKTIRKAKAEVESAKRTFEGLLAAGLVPQGAIRTSGEPS